MTRVSAAVVVDGKGKPLTLADLHELVKSAERAGVPRTAVLAGKVRVRGQVTRLEVTGT